MNFKKSFLLVSLLVSHAIQAEPLTSCNNSSPLVAVGDFKSVDPYDPRINPLIIASDNGGKQWEFVAPPAGAEFLESVACNGTQCTAIGNSIRSSQNPTYHIYTSSDPKHLWYINKNISGLPSHMDYPSLTGVSCVGNICNAAGAYNQYPSLSKVPFVLRSEDSGKSWTYINAITDLPDNKGLIVSNIHCSEQACVVVGYFSASDKSMPFIMVSQDLGRTWNYIKNIQNLPAVDNQYLKNVYCDGSNCVAVGHDNNSDTSEEKPLIIYSNDKGKTWACVDKIIGLPLAHLYLERVAATNVYCANTLCIACGERDYFLPSFHANKPLLLISRDSGKTWNYVPVPVTPKIGGGRMIAHSAHCAGSDCVILGEFVKYTYERSAFILTSKNQGKTWNLIKTITSAPANFLQDAEFNAMSCVEDQCIIAGRYYDDQKHIVPCFLLSYDHGMSWQFNQDIVGLPKDNHYWMRHLTGANGGGPINSVQHADNFDASGKQKLSLKELAGVMRSDDSIP